MTRRGHDETGALWMGNDEEGRRRRDYNLTRQTERLGVERRKALVQDDQLDLLLEEEDGVPQRVRLVMEVEQLGTGVPRRGLAEAISLELPDFGRVQ